MDKAISDYLQKEVIRHHAKLVSYKKSKIILKSNEITDFIYAIKSGLVKIYGLDSNKKETISVVYGPGDFFPLAWLIHQERPSVNFKALTECEVYLIPKELFQKNIAADGRLSSFFVQRVVHQFALFASTINNLGLKYGRDRIYYRLLVLAARFGETKDGQTVIPYINQSDLASTIKLTREGVSREIFQLEKKGVLEYKRPHIVIKDLDYLQKEIDKDIPVIFFNNI